MIKTYRGIFILNVKTIEEANDLLESDPTIKEKVLEAEIFKWYGSAALPTYLPKHKKIEKKKCNKKHRITGAFTQTGRDIVTSASYFYFTAVNGRRQF